eukprot:5827376-Prymnesium_polylepis.5
MGGLKSFANSQALAAGQSIVKTNQIIAALDNPSLVCDDRTCRPLQQAVQEQEGMLLPPRARSAIAQARLFAAKRLIEVADAGERLLPEVAVDDTVRSE